MIDDIGDETAHANAARRLKYTGCLFALLLAWVIAAVLFVVVTLASLLFELATWGVNAR